MTNPSLPPLRDMIRALVATPSVSSVQPEYDMSNRPVIDLLANWCESVGFNVDVEAVDGASGKYNLIAALGQGDNGLLLSGHSDTVPYDEALWTGDPFKLREADERLYGLGSADMKSFFAFSLEAASRLDVSQLRHPLILVATANEESNMSGGRALLKAQVAKAGQAIIGEPTRLQPVRMHKGIFMERIRVVGKSGHSSDPSLGANALEGMHAVIGALLAYRDELVQAHQDDNFAVPRSTLNLGAIRGGDNPNRICGECELSIDLRMLPGMRVATLRDAVHRRCQAALSGSAFRLEFEPLFAGIDAMETPADSALVRVAERATGVPSKAVSFGTEAPFYRALGLDTIVLGPGDIADAHQPNEYLGLDMIEPTRRILNELIKEFCFA